MVSAEDGDNIRYFLLFLETHPANERHQRMTEDPILSGLLRELFLDVDDEGERLRAFDNVVISRSLPRAKRRQHELQLMKIKGIMDAWAARGLYDTIHDRFLQFLRVSIGQGTLEDLLISLSESNEDGARRARLMAQHLERLVGNWRDIHARNMDDGVKAELYRFMFTMQTENAYNSARYSITTSSSGESSDDDEVEDERTI